MFRRKEVALVRRHADLRQSEHDVTQCAEQDSEEDDEGPDIPEETDGVSDRQVGDDVRQSDTELDKDDPHGPAPSPGDV